MTSDPPPILTIGHSNHSFDRFLELLRGAGVEAVADVRTRPVSRFCPQYNKAALEEALRAAGISYVFLGKELGGRPSDPALYRDAVADFERMAESAAFADGLEQLMGLVRPPPHPARASRSPPSPTEGRGKIAVMCSEKHPLDCHRCLLVARALAAKGLAVQHILSDGSLVSQAEIEEELLVGGDLFASREDRLAAAYRDRARKVAFKQP